MIKCPGCGFDNLDGVAYCDSCGDALGSGGAAQTPAANSYSMPSAPTSTRVIAGRYRIEREIGGGGQKLMYLAADLRLNNRLCALAELIPSARTTAALAEGKEMFRREAEILAALSNIHVVQVYDYFDENNLCYLVEEYVRGQSLQAKIAGRGRLGVDEITGLALQVLDALEYLHSLTPPLVHRDLKPDNIMLAPVTGGAEIVKLIDFGIARHFQMQRGTVHGTPGYAAPEQYRGMSEPRTDLYALGAILHYALSGRDPQEQPPFSFPPLGSVRPDLPQALCALVDQTLNNDADRRVANAAEFRTHLRAATAPQARTVTMPRPVPAPSPSHTSPPQAPLAPFQPHRPPQQPDAPDASKIEWSPAQVAFGAVQRGGSVAAATVTVRNTGRGTLEATVDSDSPDLIHVTPTRIAENQAQLRVQVDSSAVMWGHRYRAHVRLTLDHSQATVAIPVLVEAADNQAVLAGVRSLSKTALLAAPAIALAGEILLARSDITISRNLHGAMFDAVSQAADALGVLTILGVVIALTRLQRRSRAMTWIIGLIAIIFFRRAVAGMFVDYLAVPVVAAALAKGGSMVLRRACIRMLARQGLGVLARLRVLLLLMAAPSILMIGAAGWLLGGASSAAPVTSPWPAPASTSYPAAVAPMPNPPVPYPAATNPPVPYASIPRPPVPYPMATAAQPQSPPPARYREPLRLRPAPRAPAVIESEVAQRLAANGFGGVSVRVEPGGRAYVEGTVNDFSQKQQVADIARGVSGVRSVVPNLTVPKGWMGVTVTSGGGGALVQYVMPGGPASRAGIVPNDVIAGIDGNQISSQADFHNAITATAAGQTVSVTVLRAGQGYRVPVRLRKSPFKRQ